MNKYFCILLLLVHSIAIQAEDFVYPTLVQEAATLEEFIPEGWSIMDQGMGDLNKDGYPDIAFVITDEGHCSRPLEDDDSTFVTCPRILGVALWDNALKKYKLSVQSNTFIISAGNPSMDEPFVGISIDKGTLHIDFHYWSSMGSWFASNQHFIFRYQNSQFELIGFEEDSTHRASHDETYLSINYSTRQAECTFVKGETGKSETLNRTFDQPCLLTFRTLDSPNSFNRFNIPLN